MRSLLINSTDSWADYNLVIRRLSIGTPEIKQVRLPLPGGDGDLDFTDFFGGPKLGTRPLECELVYGRFPGQELPHEVLMSVINAWHGKRVTLIDSLDPGHKYTGRVQLVDPDIHKNHGLIRIEGVLDPYRLETSPTVLTGTVPAGGVLLMTVSNLRKPIIPSITVSAAATISYGELQSAVTAGTHRLWTELPEGESVLEFTAAAGTTVRVEYTRGLI